MQTFKIRDHSNGRVTGGGGGSKRVGPGDGAPNTPRPCVAGARRAVSRAPVGGEVKDGLEEAELAAAWNQRDRVAVSPSVASPASVRLERVRGEGGAAPA
jgi:hypothetical protein